MEAALLAAHRTLTRIKGLAWALRSGVAKVGAHRHTVGLISQVLRSFLGVPLLDARHENRVQLLLRALSDENEHWELLAKATHSEHVVAGVPVHVRHQVEQFALVWGRLRRVVLVCVPDAWLAILRARNNELTVGRHCRLHCHILALRPEKALLHAGAPHVLIFN